MDFLRRLLRRLNPAQPADDAQRPRRERKYTKWHVKRAAHATWPQPGNTTTIYIQHC